MESIRITSALIYHKGQHSQTVKLNIITKIEQLENVRQLLRQQYHSNEILLTYHSLIDSSLPKDGVAMEKRNTPH